MISARNDGMNAARFEDNLYIHNRGGKFTNRLGGSFIMSDSIKRELEATGTEKGLTAVFSDGE